MATHQKTEEIRRKIIKATDNLLYHKGYNLMSFSDIAIASDVPRGNLNYHFKTKDEVLAAVIEHRLRQMRQMLEDWNQTIPTPIERLKRYAQIPLNELSNVTHFGCPMGSLNTELGKSQAQLQAVSRKQFDMFRQWLESQFQELETEQDVSDLALHMLVRTQGLTTLAHIYDDQSLVVREVDGINEWLNSLKKPKS